MLSAWSTGLRQCCRYFKHKAWKVCFYMHATQQGYRTFVSRYTGCQKHEDPFYSGSSFILSRAIISAIRRCSWKGNENESRTRIGKRDERNCRRCLRYHCDGPVSLEGGTFTEVMQISPNVCRRTAWQRQIIRGVRRCIPFMQIFMKFSWSGRDAARKVWTWCRVRLVFEVPKYAILIQCSLSGYIQLQTPSEAFSDRKSVV